MQINWHDFFCLLKYLDVSMDLKCPIYISTIDIDFDFL